MIEGAIWGIFTVVMLIVAIMHPRIIYCILVVVCGICGILSFRAKKRKTAGKICKYMAKNVIGILILCYLGQGLNIFFPHHAIYEYKSDMANLKTEASQEYAHFPDIIPKEAFDVDWVCCPNMFQGSGYHKLFFYADKTYLEKVYHTYEPYATVYTYDQGVWVNWDLGKIIDFPGSNVIEEQERKQVKVFLLYDNQDISHPHNSGIYINQEQGYICFFEQ